VVANSVFLQQLQLVVVVEVFKVIQHGIKVVQVVAVVWIFW
jgi:hypothetical protein